MKVNYSLTILVVLVILIFTFSAQARVIHSERSLYRNILVEDTADLRCLKFNVKSRKTNQSCFLKSKPQELVFNYTKLMFSGLLINQSPKRILIVGLGGGTMSNTLHELFPDSVIDNVELDPAVTKVAREYFGFFENTKVKTITQDGRVYIKRALLKKQQYDWIILDAFNGDYIPEHLLTAEFLQETKGLLSEQGVLSANTFSNSRLYDHESATYAAVFDQFFSVNNSSNENRIIVAVKGELPEKSSLTKHIAPLQQRLKPYGVNVTRIFNSITTKQDWQQDTKILTDQFSPANLLNTQ
ncbi:spermidine synthase [Thalassotalea atypica]|uniref:spermidine synthase n=1 Tax=Thalassotalea atypica TaxID=2054316 RepID=UPI002572C48E|nr:fused MFS/spermidine synthase [Thalassotalea atypica]